MCSLEIAKRLKTEGVKQKSALYWVFFPQNESICQVEYAARQPNWLDGMFERVAAFTVAELGEMLPEGFLWDGTTQVGLRCDKYSGGWMVRYQSIAFRGKRAINYQEQASTEANARAKMLLYLKENKLV